MSTTNGTRYGLKKQQARFLFAGIALIPLAPLLFLQGKYTRWKVGRLPDASGTPFGEFGNGPQRLSVLAIGESTVAGVGVRELSDALGGRFAKHLADRTGTTVEWHSIGVSGITVRRTIEEILPEIPGGRSFQLVVVALGGNDVFRLTSPERFRGDVDELVSALRSRFPGAGLVFANVPMVRDAIAIPHPLKYFLAKLAKMQHFNLIEYASALEDVYYYDEVKKVADDFFSDGVHPSASGYDLWAGDLVECFLKHNDELVSRILRD